MLIHAKICHACEHYDRGKCKHTGELSIKFSTRGTCPLGRHANATAEQLRAVEKFARERVDIVRINMPVTRKKCCGG